MSTRQLSHGLGAFMLAVAVAAVPLLGAAPPAAAIEGGPLSSTANPSRFLGLDASGYWIDNSPVAGIVEYPSVNESGPIFIDGTCVPFDQGPTDLGIIGVSPDTSACLQFRAAVVSDTQFTFQVNDPAAATNGRYLSEGNGGFALDLLSAVPNLFFNAPRVVSGDLTGNAVTPAEPLRRAGDLVEVVVTARNTGNTSWVTTNIARADGEVVTCPADAVPAGGALACTTVVTLTQDLLDAPSGSLTLTGTATDATGMISTLTPATVPLNYRRPAAALTAAFTGEAPDRAGDTAGLDVVLTNTGNVTFTSASFPGTACPTVLLAPGGSALCTRDVTFTQEDFDAGTVQESATAAVATAAGDVVPVAGVTAERALTQNPAAQLNIVSQGTTATAGTPSPYVASVVNTGNVTLSEVRVTGGTCTPGTLAPGASATCEGEIVVPSDQGPGLVSLTAAATAVFNGSPVTIPPAQFTVTIPAPSTPLDPTPAPGVTSSVVSQLDQQGGLAFTGGNAFTPALAALALIATGAGLLAGIYGRARRRVRTDATR